MAYQINERCTACGDCPPACPSKAITAAPPTYRIHQLLCTECLGFSDEPQCVIVCAGPAVELVSGWVDKLEPRKG